MIKENPIDFYLLLDKLKPYRNNEPFSKTWEDLLYKCYKVDSASFTKSINRMVDECYYITYVEKSSVLVLGDGVINYILKRSEKIFIFLNTYCKEKKLKKWKKKREEDKKYYANLRLKEKYKKTGDIIGDLYK